MYVKRLEIKQEEEGRRCCSDVSVVCHPREGDTFVTQERVTNHELLYIFCGAKILQQ